MSHPPRDWLAWHQRWRRPFEIGFWAVVLSVQAVFNTVVTWLDLRERAGGLPWWQPAAWEASSVVAIGLLVPAVAWVERHRPLHGDTLRRNLPWHLLASVAFCIAHVTLIVGLRKALYAAAGEAYRIDVLRMLGYEYLKDVRTYAMILVALWSYRLVLRRLQGEARVLDAPEPPADAPAEAMPAPPPRPERFLVRKLRREFLIAAADIEWVQAQGNYVGLHVHGHDYLLRSTLADFLEQLDPARFVRVHRSYAVNLDRIVEIEPLDAGDARLRMKDGSQVPCSRRYRAALGAGATAG